MGDGLEGHRTRRPLETTAVVQGRVAWAGEVAEDLERWGGIRDRL